MKKPNQSKYGLGEPKFSLGMTVVTPGALAAASEWEIAAAFHRHERGDWGDVCVIDRKQNELALNHGGRLFSTYKSRSGEKFWVITESDRSATTILRPNEY